ncbi:MAG TPA: class I SAM-dependent methyltransferase [Candidatus Binataceae bacterium]|nr:class I SAM-dependent methyltransferase [Candidatus Binataceae bacterium]
MKALVRFYENKTQLILDKYGPGPRVHYHTGIMGAPPSPSASASELRSSLLASQEQILLYASTAWNIRMTPFREVLDVGCGLGGGAIFWAQEFGAHVTAVTIAPSHISLVSEFAAQAGVGSLVQPLLSDALTLPGESCFDAAIAIDSSSSFERRPWFHRLSKLLRPDGQVFIFDCYLGKPEYETPFNHHWCAQIGYAEEYISAAQEAGFRLEMIEDVSSQAIHFWDTSIALMLAEAHKCTMRSSKRTKLSNSLSVHALVRRGLCERGLSHTLMSFRKT